MRKCQYVCNIHAGYTSVCGLDYIRLINKLPTYIYIYRRSKLYTNVSMCVYYRLYIRVCAQLATSGSLPPAYLGVYS